MAHTQQQIIEDITAYFRKSGARYWREWYVGISKDARDRLFNGHRVREEGDWWIHRQAMSSNAAREVEAHFLELGADGGSGGGDDESDMVYAYKKATHTDP